MRYAHIHGFAVQRRRIASGEEEAVIAFRPERFIDYLNAAAGGHGHSDLQLLTWGEGHKQMSFDLAYTTQMGRAFKGDSRSLLKANEIEDGSVDLIFTSPPFALTRPKDYGNKKQAEYIEWFSSFIEGFKRIMSPTGSLVVDIGGSYLPGSPIRSTYHFELAVTLGRQFQLCQEFYWYNPAKLPAPVQWTNIERSRVKDSVNLVLWYAQDAAKTKANNRRVLKAYSTSMKSLLRNGYQVRKRPSNHDISNKFIRDNKGAIPPNLLGFASQDQTGMDLEGDAFETQFDNLVSISNTASSTRYLEACKRLRVKPHPARFPIGLPAFFIHFLSEPGDLVFDPFAGSNTTGDAAEQAGRRWVACDLDADGTYVYTSASRFDGVTFEAGFEIPEMGNWEPAASRVSPIGARRKGDS
jgi:DNA modification methylase